MTSLPIPSPGMTAIFFLVEAIALSAKRYHKQWSAGSDREPPTEDNDRGTRTDDLATGHCLPFAIIKRAHEPCRTAGYAGSECATLTSRAAARARVGMRSLQVASDARFFGRKGPRPLAEWHGQQQHTRPCSRAGGLRICSESPRQHP